MEGIWTTPYFPENNYGYNGIEELSDFDLGVSPATYHTQTQLLFVKNLRKFIDIFWQHTANKLNLSIEATQQFAEQNSVFSHIHEEYVTTSFYDAVRLAIIQKETKWNMRLLDQLLLALAIDADSIIVEDILETQLSSNDLIQLILKGLSSRWKDTRWKCIELLMRNPIPNKEEYFYKILKLESNLYVVRIGLHLLAKENKQLAKDIALQYCDTDDIYLHELVNDILI